MSMSVEGWETLINCGQVTGPLAAIANSGDIESIENALKAGVAKLGDLAHLDAVVEMADAASLLGRLQRRAEDVLIKWASAYCSDDLSLALISIVSKSMQRPHACAVLVRAGADPYLEVKARKDKLSLNISALNRALNRGSIDAINNLAGLLGTAPIADCAQLPRLLSYNNTSLCLAQPCNALEFAIATQNSHAATWLIGRIDRDSPARELLFDLGDMVLGLLKMNQIGESLEPTTPLTNTSLANAYRFIAGGAEFRSSDLWEKIFNRNILYNNDQPYLSLAVATHNGGMTGGVFRTCLGIFIDNGCLKIDSIDHNGHTMLMNAARNDSHEVVDLLLQRGASVAPTATIEGRKTPVDALHYARKSENPDMLQKILAATAKQAIARTIETARAEKVSLSERAAP
jgi:hypothetical protein